MNYGEPLEELKNDRAKAWATIAENERTIARLINALKYVAANHHEGEGVFDTVVKAAIAQADFRP